MRYNVEGKLIDLIFDRDYTRWTVENKWEKKEKKNKFGTVKNIRFILYEIPQGMTTRTHARTHITHGVRSGR